MKIKATDILLIGAIGIGLYFVYKYLVSPVEKVASAIGSAIQPTADILGYGYDMLKLPSETVARAINAPVKPEVIAGMVATSSPLIGWLFGKPSYPSPVSRSMPTKPSSKVVLKRLQTIETFRSKRLGKPVSKGFKKYMKVMEHYYG